MDCGDMDGSREVAVCSSGSVPYCVLGSTVCSGTVERRGVVTDSVSGRIDLSDGVPSNSASSFPTFSTLPSRCKPLLPQTDRQTALLPT